MKTCKALEARIKVTGSGRLKVRHPGMRHLLEKKSAKHKHKLKRGALIDKTLERNYKKLIGMA
jgi:large subunit ribosomal protein L35